MNRGGQATAATACVLLAAGCTAEVRARPVPYRTDPLARVPAVLAYERDESCSRVTPPLCIAVEGEISRAFGMSTVVSPVGPVRVSVDAGSRAVGSLVVRATRPDAVVDAGRAVDGILRQLGWAASSAGDGSYILGSGADVFRLTTAPVEQGVQVVVFGPSRETPAAPG